MEPNEILNSLKLKYGTPGQNSTSSAVKLMSNPLDNLPSSKQLESVSYDLDVNSVFNVDRNGIISSRFKDVIGNTGNENRLAQNQGALEKVYRGVAKLGTKMNLYAAESVGTWTYGVYKAIEDGKLSSLFDNNMTKFFDDQVKKLDTKFAHYYTDEEKSRGLLGQMTSMNFWTDQVTNGLAFIGGALIPEVVLGVVTGGMSAPASLAKLGLKFGAKSLFKEGAEQVTKNTVRNSFLKSYRSNLQSMAKASTAGEKIGEGLKTAGFMARSSMFEAGMEARHNLHDASENFYSAFEESYGRAPSLEETKSFLSEAQSQANGVFWGNMAMLSISNAVMFGKVVGLKPDILGLKKGWNKMIGLSTETAKDGTKVLANANKFQKALGATSKVATPFITEGLFEEAGQGILGKAMTNYLDNKYVKGDATASYWEAFADGAVEQYTTTEGLKEVMLGGIIGLLGGSMSAAITKPAAMLGIKGFEGAEFGVEGFFNQSYKADRKQLEARTSTYNQEVQKFRQTAKANALVNDTSFDEKSQVSRDALKTKSDILSYIKVSEGFKDFADINAEYDTVIDTLEFDPKELEAQGMSEQDVLDYKADLKQTFAETLEGYKTAKQIVKSVNFSKSGLKEGNIAEVEDALTQSIALSYGARDDAQTVARQIEELTGVGGVYAIEKFFNDETQNNAELVEKYKNLQKEKTQITDKLAQFGAEYASVNNKALSESKLKEQAKLREGLIQRMLELDVEIQNSNDILQERLNTLNADAFTNSFNVIPTVDEVISGRDSLNSYIGALAKAGKTTRATDIKNLLSQFQGLNAVDLAGQDVIQRMVATDFFSKSGKPLIQRIIGEKYSASDEFLKSLKDNSEMIAPILEALGVNTESLETEMKTLFDSNDALSDREKFLLESVARITLMKEGIDELANAVNERVEAITLNKPESLGDTIRRNITNRQPSNIEELSQLITEITDQISVLTSKPTLETKKLIDEKRKQLEDAKQRLLDIQNGEIVIEESPVVVENSTNEEGYVAGDVIEWEITPEEQQIIEDATIEELEEAFEQVVDKNGQIRLTFPENEETGTQTEEGSNRQPNAESTAPIYEGDTTTDTRGTESVSEETSTSNRAKQEEEITLQRLIDTLEKEIEDLEVPFKFLDSESYREYKRLTKKQINNPFEFTQEDAQRLEELSGNIDQWGILLGTDINGVTISDLVTQLVNLEDMQVTEDSNVEEVTEDEIIDDIKFSTGTTKNNFDVSVNTTAVVAKVTKKDGKLITTISNISLEGLQDRIGFNLKEGEYTMHPDTKSISVNQEVVDRINEDGVLAIVPERVENTGTYSFPIRVRVPDMNGNEVYETLNTDFYEVVSDISAYDVVDGQELSPIINLDDPYNQELTERIIVEKDNPTVSDKELEVAVTVALSKSKTYQNKVKELATVESLPKTTTNQAKVNKLKYEINDLEGKAKEVQKARIVKDKINDSKHSEDLVQELIDQLRIDLVDDTGNVVATVKGARRSTENKKETDRSALENLRRTVIANEEVFSQLETLPSGIIQVPNIKIKVDKAYAGIPNENFNKVDQSLERVYKPITIEAVKNISDIGYVQNGKLNTRENNEDVDTTFIRSSLNSNSSVQKPIIIVKKGNRKVAYPVKVGREASRADVTAFTQIRNNENITDTEKVIKMNQILADAGFDVRQPGNSLVALGEGISDEVFNDFVARLENKEYLRPINNWLNKDLSISDALINAEASTSLNLSDAFTSTKFKLDLSPFKTKESENLVDEISEESEKVSEGVDTHLDYDGVEDNSLIRELLEKNCK